MLSSVTLDDATGTPVALHETSKRCLVTASGLIGIGSLRDSKRVRPTGHGGVSETRWEDGKLIVLGGEIYSNVNVSDALNEFRVVTAPMLATLDVAPALLKWQEGVAGVAATLGTISYRDEVLADTPALYWRLGDTAGTTITDSSGNSRNGTYSSITLNQTSLLSGDADPCVLMNNAGTMHALAYAPFPAGGEIRTFEILAKRTSTADVDTFFGGSSNSMVTLQCASGSNDIKFISNAGTTVTWAGAMGGTGVTKHIVVTYNATSGLAELFVNGVTQGVLSPGTSTGTNTIACGSNTSANQWNGNLDEFAVYNGALSAARILTHFNAAPLTTTGGTPGTVGGLALQRLVKLDGDVSPTLQEAAAIVNYQAQFFAEDPRAYSQTLTTVNSSALSTSAAGVILSAAFPWLFGASSGGVAVCTNAGNRPTPPIFRILGGCTNPVITRLSNQAKLSITGTIGTGDYLELDVAKRTVKLNGSSNATNLLDSANSDWASLEVPSGTETFTMRAASNDSSAALTVFFRSAYA